MKKNLEVFLIKKNNYLKKKIFFIKKNNKENKEKFLRAKAEITNIIHRFQKNSNNIKKFAIENFAKSLLSIKDNLETTLNIKSDSIESLKEGVKLILKKLLNIFKQNNLLEINPEIGEKFNPLKHQVIFTKKSKKKTDTIVKVIQKGYLLYNRLLRPSSVIVSKNNLLN